MVAGTPLARTVSRARPTSCWAAKVAVVLATAKWAKGARRRLRPGLPRHPVTEIDPILPLQAAMEGYEVSTSTCHPDRDIFVTATGNQNNHHRRPHGEDEDKAIVGNIGTFDNEIDMAG